MSALSVSVNDVLVHIRDLERGHFCLEALTIEPHAYQRMFEIWVSTFNVQTRSFKTR